MSSPAAGSWFYGPKSQAIHLNRLSGGAGVMHQQMDLYLINFGHGMLEEYPELTLPFQSLRR